MINPVLVEGIAARRLLRRQPMEVFAGHEPEERPLARTDRAIARQYALQIALGFELDATAMTTALVFHANFSPEVDDALVAARVRYDVQAFEKGDRRGFGTVHVIAAQRLA